MTPVPAYFPQSRSPDTSPRDYGSTWSADCDTLLHAPLSSILYDEFCSTLWAVQGASRGDSLGLALCPFPFDEIPRHLDYLTLTDQLLRLDSMRIYCEEDQSSKLRLHPYD